MRTKSLLILLVTLLLANCSSIGKREKPPLAQVKPVEDTYFGTKVTDSYRYMENLKDTTVQIWFKLQADYARAIINSIPVRQALIDKIVEFDGRRSSRISLLRVTDNDRYFYLKETPDDESGKLFYRNGFAEDEVLLLDPEKYSSDTTQKFVINSLAPSFDGSKVAFKIAPNGSESGEILIMDVKNQKLYPEKIDKCWLGSPSWLSDGSSFLYNRMKSGDVHQKDRDWTAKIISIWLGTDPRTDKVVLARDNYPDLKIKPEDIPQCFYDKDSRYIFGIPITADNRLSVFYTPPSELNKDKIRWKQLFKSEDEVYNFGTTDKDLYIYTPKGAPNFKILRTSLTNPDLESAEVVIAEDPQRTLTDFTITSEGLYYTYSENGVSVKLFFLPFGEKKGTELKLPFPAGTISLSAKGFRYSDIWITITGWTKASQRYRYLSQKNEFTLENLSSTAEYPEYDDLVVEELMIPSHDGVMVPLSLIYKKNIKKDGNNPVLFYGYGSYGVSMNPFFSPSFLLWTYNGGILAVPHVRGGGELGDSWYKDGYKTTKPNTWKDLIASAEYLVNEKYTSPKRISINAGSAGGILVGRAMTERPDLFAAAIPEVGCLNTLRGEETPTGPVNAPEFGTIKDSVECMALIEMDSYLHIQDGIKYPATLITAGMNDPRVIAWQPAKFAARLQAANGSDKPILFLVDYEAGHGIGNTKSKDFESLADVLSFAFWQTGHPDFQIK